MKSLQFLTIVIFTLFSLTCVAQEKKESIEQKIEKKSKEKVEELSKKVDLSQKQSIEAFSVYSHYYEGKKELEMKIKEIEKEIKKLKLKRREELNKILNIEQKQKLELQKAKRNKRKKKN